MSPGLGTLRNGTAKLEIAGLENLTHTAPTQPVECCKVVDALPNGRLEHRIVLIIN